MYSKVRSQFIDFFKQHEHQYVQSSNLIPSNDPSLMFTNSGMVQFKNYFLNIEQPNFLNATTAQKSVRAGGKHNDLDNVGYTARHHTFFEMLGNFSFGGYFKEKAIYYAWQFLTQEVCLNKDKLYITVYHTDDEAYNIWHKLTGFGDDRILRISTNDNFWTMGDTGPCGPCSEIYYDYGDSVAGDKPGTAGSEGDRFVEVWNLVFMQFEQTATGNIPLAKPCIDTGMGLERLVSVIEGKTDNYQTSLFQGIISNIKDTYNVNSNNFDTNYRVIADHLRAMNFMIAEGMLPSNEGRGYVLRRIMRRAMRYAHQMDAKNPKMHQLCNYLRTQMSNIYPEISKHSTLIENTIKNEEESFKETLGRGLKILDDVMPNKNGTLAGDIAFKLYDTYGFPLDLTEDIMRRGGGSIDIDGFNTAMAQQKQRGKASWQGTNQEQNSKIWHDIKDLLVQSGHNLDEYISISKNLRDQATPSHIPSFKAQILAIVNEDGQQTSVTGDNVYIVVNGTTFYPEGGGQVGDHGDAWVLQGDKEPWLIQIIDTKKEAGSLLVHKVNIPLDKQVDLSSTINFTRRPENIFAIARHHTATHLLQAALRKVLGNSSEVPADSISQKGSHVNSDRLRFDFSFNRRMTDDEIIKVEDYINNIIRKHINVYAKEVNKAEAEAMGAMALFGEKYGDTVRVIHVGELVDLHNGTTQNLCDQKTYEFSISNMGYITHTTRRWYEVVSIELCGGTHVKNTSEIMHFKIISEKSVASGIRRIEAIAGYAAIDYLNNKANEFNKICLDEKVNDADPSLLYLKYSENRQKDEANRLQMLNGWADAVVANMQEYTHFQPSQGKTYLFNSISEQQIGQNICNRINSKHPNDILILYNTTANTYIVIKGKNTQPDDVKNLCDHLCSKKSITPLTDARLKPPIIII
jgi:alanyl-tRNA synthetase